MTQLSNYDAVTAGCLEYSSLSFNAAAIIATAAALSGVYIVSRFVRQHKVAHESISTVSDLRPGYAPIDAIPSLTAVPCDRLICIPKTVALLALPHDDSGVWPMLSLEEGCVRRQELSVRRPE